MSETDAAPTFRDAEPTDAEWIAGLLSDEGVPGRRQRHRPAP